MVLPSSGTLDYNSIRAEFGAPSSNVYLNLFNRTGAYVYNVPANANITTSSTGQLSVSNFYGARSKTDYAAGPGSYHSTGGKLPFLYYGTGGTGTNLPSMSDTSMLVSGASKTITGVYYSAGIGVISTHVEGSSGAWYTTMACYRNDNGSNIGNIPITSGSYGGNPGGWNPASTIWSWGGSPDNSWLYTSQLNIYKGF